MQELLQKIQVSSASLTEAQRVVADYVLSHYKDVPFLSVTALADAIGVSDTTVIKFCTRLGFPGYAGFRKALSGYVQSEITMYGNLAARQGDLSIENTLDEVLRLDRANVEQTLTNPQNRKNFPKLLAMLDAARTIYVCGFRTASMQAEFLAASLTLQDRNVVTLIPGGGHYTDQLSRITRDDLLISFVFSRYSADVIRAMQLVRREGIPCATVTDLPSSPAYGLADVAFLCETASCNYQGSYAGCTAICNAIITGACLNRREETSAYLKKLEGIFSDFGTFYL